MNPEAAIIIPTYNRRAMLRDAVASALAQREVRFELIVIDDGSTDGTWEELQDGELAQWLAAAPPYCRVVTDRTPRRGPAAARNRGAELAQSELVSFLDSDDLWAPSKLRRQIAFMQEHPQFPIAQTQELWMRNGRRVNPGQRHLKHGGEFFAQSLRTCLISPSAVMMRAELFRRIGGFDESLPACEDYDLWLRILAHFPAGLLDEALVTRRAGHPDQLSATTPALDRFRIRALLKLLASGELAPTRAVMATEVLAEKAAIYAQGLERRDHLEEARFYYRLLPLAQAIHDGRSVPAAFWSQILGAQPLSVNEPVPN